MVISVVDGEGEGGSQQNLTISLTNEAAVAGFQFVISDLPDVLSYVSISGTERTADFTISAAEGEGGVTAIGFSLTGAVVDSGD